MFEGDMHQFTDKNMQEKCHLEKMNIERSGAMKKLLFLCMMAMVWAAGPGGGPAWAYHVTVDHLSMSCVGGTETTVQGDVVYGRQTINIANDGSESLSDVGVVWNAVVSGTVFDYDNANRRWERELVVQGINYGWHWVTGYTYDPEGSPAGQNDYFSLESNDFPVYWLGDMDAGDELMFNLYYVQNVSDFSGGEWAFAPGLTCIAEATLVPVPAAVLLLGSGLGLLGMMRGGYRPRT